MCWCSTFAFRCSDWWLSLSFTSCCLQAWSISPDLWVSHRSLQVQNLSFLHCLAMDRVRSLKLGIAYLARQAYECFWWHHPALFTITGASLMMPSCAQCLVGEVLFHLFLVRRLNAVSMNGNKLEKKVKLLLVSVTCSSWTRTIDAYLTVKNSQKLTLCCIFAYARQLLQVILVNVFSSTYGLHHTFGDISVCNWELVESLYSCCVIKQ